MHHRVLLSVLHVTALSQQSDQCQMIYINKGTQAAGVAMKPPSLMATAAHCLSARPLVPCHRSKLLCSSRCALPAADAADASAGAEAGVDGPTTAAADGLLPLPTWVACSFSLASCTCCCRSCSCNLRSATLARSWDSSLSSVSACKSHDEHKSHADQHLGVLPWWYLLGGQCLLCFISRIECLRM